MKPVSVSAKEDEEVTDAGNGMHLQTLSLDVDAYADQAEKTIAQESGLGTSTLCEDLGNIPEKHVRDEHPQQKLGP